MACFANSAGGTVVVGVADSDSGPAALVGCDLEPERAKHRIFELTNPGLASVVGAPPTGRQRSGSRRRSGPCLSFCLIRRRPRGFGDIRGRAC
jgi:hypothetical protein